MVSRSTPTGPPPAAILLHSSPSAGEEGDGPTACCTGGRDWPARLVSPEQSDALIAAAPLAILAVGREGHVHRWNLAAQQLFGWDASEVLGRPLPCVPEVDRATVAAALGAASQIGVTLQWSRKDGSLIDIRCWTMPWQDEEGAFAGSLVFVVEVTDRMRAEAALAARTRHLEAVRTVAAEIARELNLTALLELIIRRAVDLVGAGEGMIRLWDDGARLLTPQAWTGPQADQAVVPLGLGEGVAGTAAQRRTGLIVNDFPASPYALPSIIERSSHTAVLAEPLVYHERLVGVLSITRIAGIEPFTSEDQDLLRLFATQAAIAIENARLFQEEQLRRQELEAVQAVSEEIVRELDLAALLRLIYARAADLTRGDGGAIYFWNESIHTLIPQSWHGFGPWMAAVRLQPGEGVAGTVAARREGMLVNDFRTSPYATPFWCERSRHVAVLAEPLLYHAELVGVIIITRNDPARPFAKADQRLLRLFATQAAIAIENARLHAAALRRAEQSVTLNTLTQTLMMELDPGQAAQAILAATQVLFPGTVGHLWERHVESTELHLTATTAAAPEHRETGEALAGRALAAGCPITSRDVATDPRWESQACAAATDLVSAVAVPLAHRNAARGALVLLTRTPHSFDEDEVALLQLFGNQAAIALEKATLFQAERGRRQELEAVQAVTEEITRELDLTALLRLIHTRAIELGRGDSGTVWLWDEVGQLLYPKVWLGLGAMMENVRLRRGEGIAGVVAVRLEGMIVNDFRRSPYAYPLFAEQMLHLHILAEPLCYRDRLIGVLTVNRNSPGHPFAPEDQRLVRLVATQAAIAIENARLFAELNDSYVRLQTAQAELIRTEKLRALGQLAAGVAHDLNNMLAAILGQVELLKLQRPPLAFGEGLATVETAAADGAQVVRRLQDFGRQRPSVPLQPCALAPIVQEVLNLTRPRWADEVQRRGQCIAVQTHLDDLPPVLGHPSEIREALTNLIFNAVDAMPDGGTLTVGGAPTLGGVSLHVTDTGIGMPEVVRQRLFEPFFTTKGMRGTGLGLSVVYGIMERHGGHITVSSTLGHGTTVTLRFRAAGACDTAAAQAPPRPLVPRRILLIDDDALVRTTLGDLLRAVGHTVVVAESGAAGLACLAETAADCVVTDLGMPGMTGWEVARTLKGQTPPLPVVLLTGWGEQAEQEVENPRIVDRVLGKPVRLQDLLAVIADLTRPRPEP